MIHEKHKFVGKTKTKTTEFKKQISEGSLFQVLSENKQGSWDLFFLIQNTMV